MMGTKDSKLIIGAALNWIQLWPVSGAMGCDSTIVKVGGTIFKHHVVGGSLYEDKIRALVTIIG